MRLFLITSIFYLVIWIAPFGSHLYAQSDWKWQNPKYDLRGIYDLQFINPQTGWAVGEHGKVMKTTDGGATWIHVQLDTQAYIPDVYFLTESLGWAVGSDAPNGLIFRTSNGGLSWQTKVIPESGSLSNIMFVDSLTGWAAGQKLLKTTNGGLNWVIQNGSLSLRKVHFFNKLKGCGFGQSGKLFLTADGGDNWVEKPSGTNSQWTSVSFVDSLRGWVAGGLGTAGGVLKRTTDGGSSWLQITLPDLKPIQAIFFLDSLRGWMLKSELWQTKDGGSQWEQITQPNHTYSHGLLSLYLSDTLTGWLGGLSGRILKTTNSGLDFVDHTSTTINSLRTVHFVNTNKGWAAGDSGTILYTNNGGNEWLTQNSGTKLTVRKVHFINYLKGWAVADTLLLNTNDGGNTWIKKSLNIQGKLTDIFFIDELVGWVLAVNGTIAKTVDGGLSWTTSNVNNYGTTSVFFLNHQLGWVCGRTNFMAKTTDGGQTWTSLNPSTSPETYQKVLFTDGSNGWSIWEDNFAWVGGICLKKSSDGGLTWLPVLDGARAFHFRDQLNGWAVGTGQFNNGYFAKTSDGGITWTKQYSNSNSWLGNAMVFTDSLNGWAVGDDGAILHTVNGGGLVGLKPIVEENLEFTLLPNPARNEITLRSDEPIISFCLVDYLGREILLGRMVNNKLDISSLVPGVYCLHLQTRQRAIVQKFIKE